MPMKQDSDVLENEKHRSLSKNEVAFLINLIDQVAKRGGFHANEFMDIGIVYGHLNDIYKYMEASGSTSSSNDTTDNE